MAGVLAGLGNRLGIDPVVLRVGFVILVVATGGLALVAYGLAWLFVPEPGDEPARLPRLMGARRFRRDWRVAAGVSLLTLSVLLAFRALGIWLSDALVWPVVLAAFGAALLWGRLRWRSPADRPAEPQREPRAVEPRQAGRGRGLYSGVFGILLVTGAALLFLSSNHILGGLRDAALTAVVVVVAVALILAPFLWRLGQSLAAERSERIRSQERAELAAHLHDSVLQTLTLMQKRAEDPKEVATLARRQERELRDWLAGNGARAGQHSFAAALRAAADRVDDEHRVAVEVVIVGDRDLDAAGEAVLGAAREAMQNAAKHAGASEPIRVYAEMEPARVEVFVRDRGSGFDLESVPADRRGVRESIIGRMERAGGHAAVRSSAGGGTEVELTIGSTVVQKEAGQ